MADHFLEAALAEAQARRDADEAAQDKRIIAYAKSNDEMSPNAIAKHFSVGWTRVVRLMEANGMGDRHRKTDHVGAAAWSPKRAEHRRRQRAASKARRVRHG